MQKLNRIRVITVIGQNSGHSIQIDLAIVAKMMDTYLKDCPREEKKLADFAEMVRMHDRFSELEEAEVKAVGEKIEDEMKCGLVKEAKKVVLE